MFLPSVFKTSRVLRISVKAAAGMASQDALLSSSMGTISLARLVMAGRFNNSSSRSTSNRITLPSCKSCTCSMCKHSGDKVLSLQLPGSDGGGKDDLRNAVGARRGRRTFEGIRHRHHPRRNFRLGSLQPSRRAQRRKQIWHASAVPSFKTWLAEAAAGATKRRTPS
jgi:hypothetical protein